MSITAYSAGMSSTDHGKHELETHWSMLIDEIRAQTLERPGLDLDATSTRPRPRHDPTRPRPRPEIQCHFTHF